MPTAIPDDLPPQMCPHEFEKKEEPAMKSALDAAKDRLKDAAKKKQVDYRSRIRAVAADVKRKYKRDLTHEDQAFLEKIKNLPPTNVRPMTLMQITQDMKLVAEEHRQNGEDEKAVLLAGLASSLEEEIVGTLSVQEMEQHPYKLD